MTFRDFPTFSKTFSPGFKQSVFNFFKHPRPGQSAATNTSSAGFEPWRIHECQDCRRLFALAEAISALEHGKSLKKITDIPNPWSPFAIRVSPILITKDTSGSPRSLFFRIVWPSCTDFYRRPSTNDSLFISGERDHLETQDEGRDFPGVRVHCTNRWTCLQSVWHSELRG